MNNPKNRQERYKRARKAQRRDRIAFARKRREFVGEKVCPDHKGQLNEIPHIGKWVCPEPDCTVACWSGPTSTPADQETRTARRTAHEWLDLLWAEPKRLMERHTAYARLAEFLGLPSDATHIGMFDLTHCRLVVTFVEQELARLAARRGTA